MRRTFTARFICVIAAGMLVANPVRAQDSDLPPGVLLLSRIKRKAVQELSNLPSFACLATFDRATREGDRKPFVRVDQVRAETAYVDGRELFAWPGSTEFSTGTLAQIVGVGMAGSGEFIAHARTVFVTDAGTIRYKGLDEFAGRPAVRYDYQVSPMFSGFKVSVPTGAATIGIKGSFWADRDSMDLLHLTVAGDDVPAGLGIRSIVTDIDYRRNLVGGTTPVLLPQSAITTLEYVSGKANRNRVEYTHCRQYSAESTVSFDVTTRQPGPPGDPTVAAETVIPPLLICRTRLETSIDSDKTSVGDPISATVEGNVELKHRIVIPAGAQLTGRVRMLQKDGPQRYIVGLEFTGIVLGEQRARFTAILQRLDGSAAVQMIQENKLATREHTRYIPDEPFGSVDVERRETIIPPQLPGVATFFVLKSKRFELPPGLLLEWRTAPAGTRKSVSTVTGAR